MGVEELKAIDLDRLLACGLTPQQGLSVLVKLDDVVNNGNRIKELPHLWRLISKFVLSPDVPFGLHQMLYKTTYLGWDQATAGPPPCWTPTPEGAACTNTAHFMKELSIADPSWRAVATGNPCVDWPKLLEHSVASPDSFWPILFQRFFRLKFHHPPARILEDSDDPDSARWLPGAAYNIAECALSVQDPDRPAIVWSTEKAPTAIKTMTRGELAVGAQHVADALHAWGLSPGDRVAIDMTMGPESVMAFLGTILAGCIVVCIAESFAVREIGARLHVAGAKAIFTQDAVVRGGKTLPLYSRVVEAGAPKAVVLPVAGNSVSGWRPGDLTWDAFLALVHRRVGPLRPHIADAYSMTSILFSSGTTGEPKAIPWTHATPLRAASDAFFHQDVRVGDIVAWPTSLGWMMGPWLVYATLLNGAAMALYEGSPVTRGFGEFIGAARVAVLGLVPSVARAWKISGCMEGLEWSALRCFSSTGEASAPDEYLWLMARGKYCPVIEYCGGTEIGGGFLTGSMLQAQSAATFSTAAIGTRPVVLVEGGGEVPVTCAGSSTINVLKRPLGGEIALYMPLLGASQRLLNADHAAIYYAGMPRAGLRRHGDEVQVLPGGYCKAHGRVDDTMNLGGIKVSSVELERAVVQGVVDVEEAAAVALPSLDGGPDELVLFLVLRAAANKSADLLQRCQAAISSRLNPLFKVAGVEIVAALPRTASNKVMRRVLRDEAIKKGKRIFSGSVVSRL